LAVSGGADSLFLLHIMPELVRERRLSLELKCAHLNHQLRGNEAQGDEHFVRDQARALGIAFVSEPLPVAEMADRMGLSMETAARRCRLERLTLLARRDHCSAVATGHHLDDNAETLLFRLLRGTAYRGLAGIPPLRGGPEAIRWIRPLLGLTRREIHAFLQHRGITWREDRTNRDTSIRRNYIRHRLLPALDRESDRPLARSLAELADAAYRMQRRVDQALDSLWRNHTVAQHDRIVTPVRILRDASPWLRAAWFQRALEHIGCAQQHIRRVHYHHLETALSRSRRNGGQTLPGGYSLAVEADGLVLRPRRLPSEAAERRARPVQVPGTTRWGPWTLVATPVSEVELPVEFDGRADPSRRIEYLDADQIRGALELRPRRPGDRFRPLGSAGSRKVGKFLSDCKLSRTERDRVAILKDREKIVCVVPLRISEAVRLRPDTRRALRMEFRTA
jgi:tRNA(Ile)-lysidine synthase